MSEWQSEPRDHTGDYDPDIPELHTNPWNEPYWQDAPIGHPFVVEWTDGTFSTKDEKWVSETIDLADTGYGDEVKQILAADENGKLVPIKVGKQIRVSNGEAFYYAHSKICAGTRIVGTVAWSDH